MRVRKVSCQTGVIVYLISFQKCQKDKVKPNPIKAPADVVVVIMER